MRVPVARHDIVEHSYEDIGLDIDSSIHELALAPGFIDHNRDGIRKIKTARVLQHWDA